MPDRLSKRRRTPTKTSTHREADRGSKFTALRLFLSWFRLFRPNFAPSFCGNKFASDGTAWTVSVICLARVENAVLTHLLRLMLWIFFLIDFGRILFVSESDRNGIGLF